jgi:hypothetical protein
MKKFFVCLIGRRWQRFEWQHSGKSASELIIRVIQATPKIEGIEKSGF